MNTKLTLNSDFAFVEQIREVLENARFDSDGIKSLLHDGEKIKVAPASIPRFLNRTQGDRPLDTLVRMFVLRVPVTIEAAKRAVSPMSLESWCEGGLLERYHDMVMASIRLMPYGDYLIAFDPALHEQKDRNIPDMVHGISRSSQYLLDATIRQPVKTTLDLGTGCGIQGLICSGHSQQVVSTDVNLRALDMALFNARINRIHNIEFLNSNLFDALAGKTFDLVTMNPPFAISPDMRFVFCDSGMNADGFMQKLITEAPLYLNENGFCQIVGQWAVLNDQDWQDRLYKWVADNGCDVWIICLDSETVDVYAETWLSESEDISSPAYGKRYNQWMSYYESLGIEKVCTGIINMRRRHGSNWFKTSNDIERIDQNAGKSIALGFDLYDFLDTGSDSDLLSACFRVSSDVNLHYISRSQGNGWSTSDAFLKNETGLLQTGNIDLPIAQMLGQCNGDKPLSALIAQLARSMNLRPEIVEKSALELMRKLIEHGHLLPADDRK